MPAVQSAMVKDKLKQDSVDALKNHDQKKVDVLRYLISLIDKRALQLPLDGMNETEESKVLLKELKNKEESREMFKNAGRDELVADLDFEIKVLSDYLPKALSEEEIKEMVKKAVEKNGVNFGMVMKEVMVQVAGRADGSVVSRIVKENIDG